MQTKQPSGLLLASVGCVHLCLWCCSGWLWTTVAMSESELLATAGMDALVSTTYITSQHSTQPEEHGMLSALCCICRKQRSCTGGDPPAPPSVRGGDPPTPLGGTSEPGPCCHGTIQRDIKSSSGPAITYAPTQCAPVLSQHAMSEGACHPTHACTCTPSANCTWDLVLHTCNVLRVRIARHTARCDVSGICCRAALRTLGGALDFFHIMDGMRVDALALQGP